jgi:hypothetical protein
MTPLQKQSYNLWFNHIANLVMQWSKEKPANTDLKNMVQGMTEIGQYVNGLTVENDVLKRRFDLLRADKNKQIIMFKEQIEKLENELKKYDI